MHHTEDQQIHHQSASPGPRPRMPASKYRPYQPVGLTDRTWPDRRPATAPLWAGVDLRDGNQALIDPMDAARRRRLFDLLVGIGVTEIEVGFPASCRSDFTFVTELIEHDRIPEHVVPQVLCPAREDLLERTALALRGARQAILQVFHPVSETQRRVVFHADRAETKAVALRAARHALELRDRLARSGTRLLLQYGPESFTQCEPEFALELCNAVLELWDPQPGDGVRVNLPSTVEAFGPHEFADRIEYMHRGLLYRDRILLGVHCHNDRGGAVAAGELAWLAGADRIEGTLFGNGERAGNLCLVTLAMNLYTQGIDPGLDLSDLDGLRRVVEECTRMQVPPRHPWAGDFVHTSFAGSHQDAISKGLRAREVSADETWDVPYLPVDPRDIGHDYRALIRVNEQSGKGGIAHLLRGGHGLELPRRFLIEFAALVQRRLDRLGGELGADDLWRLLVGEFGPAEAHGEDYSAVPGVRDAARSLAGRTGPLDAVPFRLPSGRGAMVLESDVRLRAGGGGAQTSDPSWAACAEVLAYGMRRWGFGLGDDAEQALARAIGSAVRRAAVVARDTDSDSCSGSGSGSGSGECVPAQRGRFAHPGRGRSLAKL